MTTPFISLVTVTGADDTVSPSELVELQRRYPFVEFGILLSLGQSGMARFPSRHWLDKLTEVAGELRLSGHLCGQYVRDFLTGKLRFDIHLGSDTAAAFSRWQINTHAIPHAWDIDGLMNMISGRFNRGQPVIFQYDQVNTEMIYFAVEHDPGNIAVLFDLSHGAGILPEAWPPISIPVSVGYAGGLSPDNVAGELEKIAAVAKGKTWIDAETRLRSGSHGMLFDLDLVERFLQAAEPYVIKEGSL